MDRQGGNMVHDNPWVCNLSGAELQQRKGSLHAEFKSACVSTEELPDGHQFRLAGDRKALALIADLIGVERECCPFLTFQWNVEPSLGPISLRVTGPTGAKEFLKSTLA